MPSSAWKLGQKTSRENSWKFQTQESDCAPQFPRFSGHSVAIWLSGLQSWEVHGALLCELCKTSDIACKHLMIYLPRTLDTDMQKVTCRNMFDKPRNCLLWIHSINLAIKKRRLQESEQTLWERNRRFEYALFNVYTFTVCVVLNASIRLNLGPILTQNVLHQGLHLVNQRLWFSNLASSDTVQISFQNISNVCSLPGVWVPNNMAYQHEQGAPNLAWGTWTAERRHLEARWGRKP